MIEKCRQFRRELNPKDPRIEYQICTAVGTSAKCGGFSDGCHVPELFKAINGRPNSEITFPPEDEFRKVYLISGRGKERIYWKRRITPTQCP